MNRGLSRVVKRIVKITKPLLLVSLLACTVSGCATKKGFDGTIFFPPAPDEPHVQYLTGITSSQDLGEKQSEVSRLLTGGAQVVTKIGKAYGVTAKGGKIYVCDVGSSQIIVIDFAKKTMKDLNHEPGEAELRKPISVAVDDDGNVFVADNGRKDIAVYDANGKYLRSIGKDLKHTALVGVAVYKQFLLALDNREGKIFVMDRKTGELLSTIGESKDPSQNMALPNGMSIDSKGNIHVVNMGNGKVKEYDLDGHLLSEFGKMGDVPGEFTRPRGIAVDDDGQIFIADAGHQVVQAFNEEHHILGHFGKPGLPAGSLNLPAGVAVTKDNLDLYQALAAPGFKLKEVVLVVNQYSSPINHALAIYGIGEMEAKGKK
jgi:DNA-binding beta-propeller fold protein YncE